MAEDGFYKNPPLVSVLRWINLARIPTSVPYDPVSPTPSGPFPSGFLAKILYVYLTSPATAVCLVYPINRYFRTLILQYGMFHLLCP
jgi:hypothetical protein